MLESVVKAQAQARGELLPAGGPAKVQEIPGSAEADDQLASDFEQDFNLALTNGMPEYVPDLDRGLFSLFYSGNLFRYGYHCPIKARPRVDTVGVEDLIVSEEASNLETATRWTMRSTVSPMEMRRRQYYGLWRDCDLGVPLPSPDPANAKLDEIAGISPQGQRPQDQPFEVFATVTDLDLAMHGLKEPKAPRGLSLPYRVTLEKSSRQILRIERFWKQGDKKFQRKRRCVHYQMVPGFGFLAYGFLHLQGNNVATLTAIVRQLTDTMLFANFPGGLKIKDARTERNNLEPSPGEFVDVAVPATVTNLRDAIMALPYKDLSPVAIQFYELIQQAAQRVGAAAQLEVGEGRANTPVGTIMAMLEEKTIVMSAIHKRLHEAMRQELIMIRELFLEDPQAFTEVLDNPKRAWAARSEFTNLNLVPASDPNVPSQVHRTMLATALATLSAMPQFMPRLDLDDILKRVLRMVGISDADKIVIQPPPQGPGTDPGAAQAQAKIQTTQMNNQQKTEDSQRKAASSLVEQQQRERDSQRQAQGDAAQRQNDFLLGQQKVQIETMKLQHDAELAERQHQHDVQQGLHEQQMAEREHVDALTMEQHRMAHDQQLAAQRPPPGQGGGGGRSFGGDGGF
jgi:hypothetical protein